MQPHRVTTRPRTEHRASATLFFSRSCGTPSCPPRPCPAPSWHALHASERTPTGRTLVVFSIPLLISPARWTPGHRCIRVYTIHAANSHFLCGSLSLVKADDGQFVGVPHLVSDAIPEYTLLVLQATRLLSPSRAGQKYGFNSMEFCCILYIHQHRAEGSA